MIERVCTFLNSDVGQLVSGLVAVALFILSVR